MKRAPSSFVLCLSLIGQIVTPTANATLLIVSASKQKVILAADSRMLSDYERYSDTACKIEVLNSRLVFTATGLAADVHPSLLELDRFNVFALARKSASEYRFDPESMVSPYGSVNEIAKMWGREMFSRFQSGAPVRLTDWLRGIQGKETDPFVTGIFIGVEGNKELKVVFTTLEYAGKPRQGEIRPTARPVTSGFDLPGEFTWIETFGIKQIANEHLKNNGRIRTEQRKNAEFFDEKIPTELIELSINDTRWNQHPGPKGIGGAIDSVEVIPDRGVRWIQRKPNCPPG